MTLPAIYEAAELAARPNLDRPDTASLEQLLAMDVEACGQFVATQTDETIPSVLALREALPRAARILNPNAYVPIANYPPNVAALIAGIESTCPIFRRFAAAQYFIDAPRQDTSWGATLPPFPTDLQPDGDVIYVPYVDGDTANVTVESVAAVEAPASEPAPILGVVTGVGDVTLPFNVDAHHALDSLPAGSTATKTDANTIVTTHGTTGIESQTVIGQDDATAHLPINSTIDVLAQGQPAGIALTLPANAHRSALTVIGDSLHDAVAKAWAFIVNLEHTVVADVEKL